MDIFHLLIILAKYISPTPDSPGLCKNHSMAYIDALATGKSWAVKMQDSTAKLQAGILTGNFHSLGSYDECISIQEVENPWGNIEGQYCLATFKLQNDTTGDDVESIFQEVISQEEYINIGVGAILAKGLRWGFCIPTSCTSENLRTHLTDYLGANGHINVDVQTPDCRSYNIDSRYICRLNIFVFLIATSILILVIISILNRCIFRESWRALYEYIASNYNGLTFLNNEQSVGNLPSLDGIKALSLIWLLIGQSYLLTASLPAINYISIIENMSKWPYMLLLKTQLVADSFLVCGGALASYHFHRDMVQRKKLIYTTNGYYSTGITWKYFFIYSLKYDFHRIIRLFPTLSITVILYNIYISYDKSGPLSYPANSWHEDICWSNLHRTLLFIANLIDGQNICLQSTWYIMVDLQLHLLSPFILFLLIKYKSRHCCAISIVVSGILFNIFIKYRELPTYFSDSKCKTKYNIYDVATKTKFSSWLIGIILGYLLFHFKATNEYPEIKWWWLIFCWIFAIFCMSAAIFGLYPFLQPNSELNTYVLFATYSATNHIIWAFGVAWVIFACETHNGGKIRALLSLKMWRQLSCLSYSIYLVHLPLMSLNIIAARAPIYINWMSGIEYFAGDFLILLSAGLLLHTVVERPFMYFFKFCSSMLDVSARSEIEQFYRDVRRRYPQEN